MGSDKLPTISVDGMVATVAYRFNPGTSMQLQYSYDSVTASALPSVASLHPALAFYAMHDPGMNISWTTLQQQLPCSLLQNLITDQVFTLCLALRRHLSDDCATEGALQPL